MYILHDQSPSKVAHDVQNKTYSDIRATAAVYSGHISKMQVQMKKLAVEHSKLFEEKDATIADLELGVYELKSQNKDLSCSLNKEANTRKVAVAGIETLTKQHEIQGKKVMTLSRRVAELGNELAQEKAKHTADKGANEKLRSITEKCAEIARLVAQHP